MWVRQTVLRERNSLNWFMNTKKVSARSEHDVGRSRSLPVHFFYSPPTSEEENFTRYQNIFCRFLRYVLSSVNYWWLIVQHQNICILWECFNLSKSMVFYFKENFLQLLITSAFYSKTETQNILLLQLNEIFKSWHFIA